MTGTPYKFNELWLVTPIITAILFWVVLGCALAGKFHWVFAIAYFVFHLALCTIWDKQTTRKNEEINPGLCVHCWGEGKQDLDGIYIITCRWCNGSGKR